MRPAAAQASPQAIRCGARAHSDAPRGSRRTARLMIAPVVLLIGACGQPAAELPVLDIDPSRVTVSGLSSGAYMAHQVHLAYSTRIAGAALIAGGPYACAGGELSRALEQCIATDADGPDVAALAAVARDRASKGLIDPLSGLTGDRVWVFHGDADRTVAAAVTAAVAPLYRALAPALHVDTVQRAGVAHTFPTLESGGDCAASAAPYLGRCGFDAAGEIFRVLYGTHGVPVAPAGALMVFDQQAYGSDARLADTGYVYVPPQCRTHRCGLHLVFHGCEQSAEKIGMAFIEGAGYQRWADLADVVLVFPQTHASLIPLNPKACWDWWGYTGAPYDTREGAQVSWVGRLLDHYGVRP